MADQQDRGSSFKSSDGKNPSFISNAEQVEADNGYFEQKLEEFKDYFRERSAGRGDKDAQVARSPENDSSRIKSMITIYEFILGRNKDMLKAINRERKNNEQYRRQLPLLLDRLQCLNEACIKKEEMIKQTGEYMQESENQIFDLKQELAQKDSLIKDLNKTISDQREKLDSKYLDSSNISFDSKLNDSRLASIKGKNGETSFHNEADLETIKELKDDIGQLLKEYKILEKQKDEFCEKYHRQLKRNDELLKDIINMEVVITDQNDQIRNMRDKLKTNFKQQKRNEILVRNIGKLKKSLDISADENHNENTSSLNINTNILKQGNLAELKQGKKEDSYEHIDEETINDALNLSYQVLDPGLMSQDLPQLISRSRKNKDSSSTAAEGESQSKSCGKRVFSSIDDFSKSKLSQSICVMKLKENNIDTKQENTGFEGGKNDLNDKSILNKSSNSKSKENSMFSFQGETKDKLSPTKPEPIEVGEFSSSHQSQESLDKAERILKQTKQEGKAEEDTQLLREVYHNLGPTDSVNPNQEISCLGINESQFQGIGEDSQFNGVLDISEFQKESILEKYEMYEEHRESELLQRNRISSEISTQSKAIDRRKSGFSKREPPKSPQNLFDQSQNFPDFETSAIGTDGLHMIDKEFGDGSFINPATKRKLSSSRRESNFGGKVLTPEQQEKDISNPSNLKTPEKAQFVLTEEKKDPKKIIGCGSGKKSEENIPYQEKLIPDQQKISQFGKQLSKITGKKTPPTIEKRLSGSLSDHDPNNEEKGQIKKEISAEEFKAKGSLLMNYNGENYEYNAVNEMNSFGATPQKVNQNVSIMEGSLDDSPSKESSLPTNKDVEEALQKSDDSFKVQNISFVDPYEENEEQKYEEQKYDDSQRIKRLVPPVTASESANSHSHARNYTEHVLLETPKSHDLHVRHKSNKHKNQESLIEKKARTWKEDSDLPSDENLEDLSSAQRQQNQAFFCITPMALEMGKDGKPIDPRASRFRRTGKDVKFPFQEGSHSGMDADFLNKMYENKKKRKKNNQKKKRDLTKYQKKQRHRVKNSVEFMYWKILDNDYDIDNGYFKVL